MDAAVYANVITTRYTSPMYPGPHAQYRPRYTEAAQADANAIQKEERRVYSLNENVDAALRQEVIAEVEETYSSVKNQQYMGLLGVSSKGLLDHIMDR